MDEINAYLFAYLDLLKGHQIEEWIYQEQATVAQLAFRFSEKTSAMNAVRSIAPALQHYPAEDLLVAPYLMEEFDASLIRSFLILLTKDNVLMTLSAPGYKGQSDGAHGLMCLTTLSLVRSRWRRLIRVRWKCRR